MEFLLPVSADIERDGQQLVWWDTGQGGVQGQLAHWDTHALCTVYRRKDRIEDVHTNNC